MSHQSSPDSSDSQSQNIQKSNLDHSQVQQGQARDTVGQNQGSGTQTIQNINQRGWFNLAFQLVRDQLVGATDYRKFLINKVRKDWVLDFLEKRLDEGTRLDLLLEERPDAVVSPSGMDDGMISQRRLIPQGKKIIDLFDELKAGRTFLILGEPGSGKTITLLEMARDLLTKAENDANHAIPVVLHLSTWKDDRSNLAEWLVQELYERYEVSRRIGKGLIANEKLLLLLDGLDEVQERHRISCIQALNKFCREHGCTEIVVCCRVKDYEALYRQLWLTIEELDSDVPDENVSQNIDLVDPPLRFRTAIFIQTLTPQQVERYVDICQADTVKVLLQQNPTLQELAKSPLMLNVMTLAYQGLSADQIPNINPTQIQEKHLFDAYFHRMFSRKRQPRTKSYNQPLGSSQPSSLNQRYQEQDLRHWLSWLAQRMNQESQTIFLIERMQPTWLLNSSQRQIYRIICLLLSGLLMSSIAGISGFLLGFVLPDSSLLKGVVRGLFYGFICGLLFPGITTFVLGNSLNPKQYFQNLKHLWKFERKKFLKGLGLYILFSFAVSVLASLFGIEENNPFTQLITVQLYIYITSDPDFFLDTKISHRKSMAKLAKLQPIEPVETLKFSWSNLRNLLQESLGFGFLSMLPVTLIFIIVFAIILFSEGIKQGGFWLGLAFGALGSLLGVLLGSILSISIGLFWGIFRAPNAMVGPDIENRTVPNQGIRQSTKYLLIFSLIGLIGIGLLAFSITLQVKSITIALLVIGISFSVFWMAFGIFRAGRASIQHLALRLVLNRSHNIPWNYARFLDYADERIFLKKTGGGYMFIHRWFLEGFANLEPLQVPAYSPSEDIQVRQQFLSRLKNDIDTYVSDIPNVLINLSKLQQPWQVMRSEDYPENRFNVLTSQAIIEIFNQIEVAGKLLILGMPGSGKTLTTLELTKVLINRAESDDSEPIPILLNLASWKAKKFSITNWLISELKLKYGIREDISQQWLNEGQIAPLLDDLDKLPSERQNQCIQAINYFQQKHQLRYLVVCSQVTDYELCNAKLHLNSAICLQPLSARQVHEYLIRIGYSQLWQDLQNHEILLEFVESPMILNMLVEVYSNFLIQELEKFSSHETRLKHLITIYLSQKSDENRKANQATPNLLDKQLGWLAKSLKQESQAEFSLEQLQPMWLKHRLQRWSYRFTVGLILGFMIGFIPNLAGDFSAGLITGISERLVWSPAVGLLSGLGNGLSAGLLLGCITGVFAIVKRGLVMGLTLLLLGFLLLGIDLLRHVPDDDLLAGLSFTLAVGAFAGLSTQFIGWLVDRKRIETTQISLSRVTTRVSWGVGLGLLVGLIAIRFDSMRTLPAIMDGLLVGGVIGLIAALPPLTSYIQYYVLRLVMHYAKLFPLNENQLLKVAMDRQILKKIGDRYQFSHRWIQDYFARLV